ncbi:hypothetical protein HA402_015156 [Bradysia odoriphaga]|nr:hypothetical protein HA402_015156 [Bradysia odoriphaga]
MASFVVFFALLVATFTTNVYCDDGTAEATILALEISGRLLALPQLVKRIQRELKTIRTAYPEVSSVGHSPRWAVGVLIANVSDEQLEQIRIQYGEVTSRPMFEPYKVLTFAKPYNPEALAKELTSKNLVQSAEPDSIIGGGNKIEYNTWNRVYTFSQGWGDCQAGCINKHFWDFYVFSTRAFLLREYGTPLNGGTDVAVAEEGVDASIV